MDTGGEDLAQGAPDQAHGFAHDPEQTKRLLATTLDGFVLADTEGQVVDVNPAYCQMVGYSASELLRMNIREIEATLDSRQVEERIAQMMRDGRARFETRHRHKSGELVELDVSVCIIGSPERPLVAAFARDLTAQRHANRELEKSNLLLEKAQQLAHLGIWQWDVPDNRVTWSRELHRIYGLDPERFGASFEAYLARVHPDDRERVRQVVVQAVEARSSFDFGERIVRPSGEVRWLHSWGSVVTNDEGAPVRVFGACLDITEQKLAQAALQQSNEALEQRVRERTAELAEAKDRAESADKLKSAFLASMSHELRTPLNSIIGFTGILLQGLVGELNAEQRKQLGMVQGSSQHLLSLINDLLDISKIEVGQLELNRETVAVRELAEEARRMMEPLAEDKGLTLELLVGDSVDSVQADRRRLKQVLINLLSNAVKFTEAGRVRLEVACEQERLRFRVSDTGIGIAQAHLQAIFAPFQQVDDGIARRHEGTGLGLAICERLTKMMGGAITVTSELGRGSSFEVTLPLG